MWKITVLTVFHFVMFWSGKYTELFEECCSQGWRAQCMPVEGGGNGFARPIAFWASLVLRWTLLWSVSSVCKIIDLFCKHGWIAALWSTLHFNISNEHFCFVKISHSRDLNTDIIFVFCLSVRLWQLPWTFKFKLNSREN